VDLGEIGVLTQAASRIAIKPAIIRFVFIPIL